MQLLTHPERIKSIVIIILLTPVTLIPLTDKETMLYDSNKV